MDKSSYALIWIINPEYAWKDWEKTNFKYVFRPRFEWGTSSASLLRGGAHNNHNALMFHEWNLLWILLSVENTLTV